MPRPGRPFVLLDRDGTLVVERHYLSDPAALELLPGVGSALRRLRELGFGLAVVSNQSGLARGYFTLGRLHEIHARLRALLACEDVELDGIYWCPHHPDDGCECRKPRPGLALKAAAELQFDVREAIVVGDNVCDVELARGVGAQSCLVLTGHGQAALGVLAAAPDFIAADLRDAVATIERVWTAHPQGTSAQSLRVEDRII